MRTLSSLVAVSLLAVAVGGCSLVYKPDIQQGNVIDQAKFEQLKPGLTQQQVVALLGEPSVVSPFNSSEWDYASSLQKRGGKITRKTLRLFFENGVLARTEGTPWVQTGLQMGKQVAQYPTVLHDKKKEAEARRKRGG